MNTLTMLGRARIVIGKTAEARDALDRAKQLAVAMIDQEMRVDQMRLDLNEIEALMASLTEDN